MIPSTSLRHSYDDNGNIICTAFDQNGNNYDGNDTTDAYIYDGQVRTTSTARTCTTGSTARKSRRTATTTSSGPNQTPVGAVDTTMAKLM